MIYLAFLFQNSSVRCLYGTPPSTSESVNARRLNAREKGYSRKSPWRKFFAERIEKEEEVSIMSVYVCIMSVLCVCLLCQPSGKEYQVSLDQN